jgi:outer membrane protein OmpA-like peptidoglycan-associated protein
MHRVIRWAVALALLTIPLAAQQQNLPDLTQAQQVLILADSAGAQIYAKSLVDDAVYRIRFAQENINSPKASMQEQARMRGREALFTARAALAKARWLSTNQTVNNLQADIRRFGGTSNITLTSEDPNIDYRRGATTKERIAAAQSAIDQARAAGAEQSVPDNDLATAIGNLDSARKVSRDGRDNSDVADYLAYISEMIARRAYYAARFNESSRLLPDVQLQRTRLAQSYSERDATTERAQREEAERRAADLQRQLNAESANRQAQTAELERLRSQVDETRRAMQQRIDADRAARVEAERNLDEAMRQYEAAAASGNQADIDRFRRQVEDQEIALRAIQERERLDEAALNADIEAIRNNPQRQADVVQRQAMLEQYQQERQADVTARADIQRRHEAAIAAAQQQRQQAESQAQVLRAQIEQAQAAAQQSAQAAQAAQQQAQQTQQQLEASKQQAQQQLQAVQQQAAQTQQQLAQQAQQSQSDAEKARQAAQAVQAELEKTREELARRDAETRQLRMQQELARIAATKSESRGLVVTLSGGILFDAGKTTLKAGAKKTLDRIAEQLKSDPAIKVVVEGHTDNTGKSDKNMALSEKRAQAVRDYLVSKGVPEDRITASGKGASEPVATNKTVAGRQANRRVELVITRS